jgi:hypothetical protein
MAPKKNTNKEHDRVSELEWRLELSLQENSKSVFWSINRSIILILGTTDPEVLKCIAIKQAQEARYRSDKQIMKPGGQAGWGSGYTLELPMGLENEHFPRTQVSNRLYSWIYAAKKALETRKNIYIRLLRHTAKHQRSG